MPRRRCRPPRRGTARPSTAGWRCRPSRVLLRSGSLPVAANARTSAAACPRRCPQAAGCPQVAGGRPRAPRRASRCAVTDAPPADAGAAPVPPASGPCRGATGAVDVEVTAHDDDRLGDVLARPRHAPSAVPVPGLWAGVVPAARRPAAHRPGARPRRRPRTGRPGAGTRPAGRVQRPGTARRRRPRRRSDRSRSGRGAHVLGRGGDVRVRLDDPDVSRRHVRGRRWAAGRSPSPISARPTAAGSTDVALDGRPRAWPTGAVLRLGRERRHRRRPGGPPPARGARHRRGRLRLRPAAPAERARRRGRGRRSPRPPDRAATPPAGLGRGRAPRGRRRAHGLAAAHAHVPVLRPAQPGGGAGHLALRALVGPAHRPPRAPPRTRWTCSRRRRRSPTRWPPTSGRPRPPTRTSPRSRPRPGAARTCCGAVRAATPTRSPSASGCGPGRTRVTRVEADGTRVPRTAPTHLPVAVDLRAAGGLARRRARGSGRSACSPRVVAQLAALHAPGEVDLLLLDRRRRGCATGRGPDGCRTCAPGAVHVRTTADRRAGRRRRRLNAWLTGLAARRRRRRRDRGSGAAPASPAGWLVVVVDRPLDPRVAATLRAARDAGVVVLTAGGRPPRTCRCRSTPSSGSPGRPATSAVLSRQGAARSAGHRASTGCPGRPPRRSPATSPASRPAASARVAPPPGPAARPARPRRCASTPATGSPGPGRRRATGWSPTLGRTADGPGRRSTCAARARTRWSPAPPDRASPSCCRR